MFWKDYLFYLPTRNNDEIRYATAVDFGIGGVIQGEGVCVRAGRVLDAAEAALAAETNRVTEIMKKFCYL